MNSSSSPLYSRYLIAIAGLGGLLYGVDVGIISAALLFIGKTIPLTLAETSIIVSAVLGGSMASSLVAGILADRFGRKVMMIASGALFLASVLIIVSSHTFFTLFGGRLLQGISGGVIAVVIPLFLAETLSAETRGRGSAIFQFMLTVGILVAAGIGWHYTQQASIAISAAGDNKAAIFAAQSRAWRSMFLTVACPGVAFLVGCLFLSETPRWLLKRGRRSDALTSLRRSLPIEEAERQFKDIEVVLTDSPSDSSESGNLGIEMRISITRHFAKLKCVLVTVVRDNVDVRRGIRHLRLHTDKTAGDVAAIKHPIHRIAGKNVGDLLLGRKHNQGGLQ